MAYLRPLIALGAGLALTPALALARPPLEPATPPRDEPPPPEPTPAPPEAAPDAPRAEPAASPAPPPVEPTREPVPMASTTPFQPKPPPLHVEYLQYGVALAANARLASGATCPENVDTPCILGGGGGLVVRVGWRPPGPWYFGSAYEFANMDSGNLYRLGILQQLRVEMRYMPETGLRTSPYVSWGLGGFGYGNEWGVETGGAVACGGGGVEFEVTRFALVGVGVSYSPMLIAGWTDTANQVRELSLAHFMRFELVFELRSELSRDDPDAWQVAAGTPPSL